MASFGKSQDGTYYEWVGDEGSIYTLGNKYVTLSNSSFSSSMRSVIPAYTQLSRVDVCLRWKTSIGSSKGDGYLYIGDTKVGGEWNTGKDWRDDWVTGLQGYFQSGTANTGLPTSEIRGRFEASWGRTSYYVFKIRWYPKYTITVNNGTGGGTYNMGSTITISAEEPTGYDFVQWNDGVKSISRTVTVTSNATYTPEFKKKTFTISGISSPTEGGEIYNTGVYEYGKELILIPQPSQGYFFLKWSDGYEDNPREITVTENATYTAIFAKSYVQIEFRDWDGTLLDKEEYQPYGTTVNIPKNPTRDSTYEKKYEFIGWSPEISLATEDKIYTAQYKEVDRIFNITVQLSTSADQEAVDKNVVIQGEGQYKFNDLVTLSVTNLPKYHFLSYWMNLTSGTPVFSFGEKETVTQFRLTEDFIPKKGEDLEIRCGITGIQCSLNTFCNPENGGYIEIKSCYPPPINSSSGKFYYYAGAKIVIEAVSSENYKFIKWENGNTNTVREIHLELLEEPESPSIFPLPEFNYTAYFTPLELKFKSVKIYYPTGNDVASPDNPLIGGDSNKKAQIVVQVALE